MTGPEGRGAARLRESLRDLADAVQPADLHAGAVRRSRGIARREATVGTAAALAGLAVLASGLWRVPGRHQAEQPRAAARPPVVAPVLPEPAVTPSPIPTTPLATHRSPASSPAATQRRKNQPRAAATIATPKSRSLADLPGRVFYEQTGDKPDVLRMSPADGRTVTVLSDAPSPVGISPDGDRIAYEVGGDLLVVRTDGGHPDRVAVGVTTTTQAPTWSPDGNRLLVDATSPAILRVDTGTLTRLPAGLGGGQHFRWSGDGTKLVYATSYCGLRVAGSDDATAVAVPMLGDRRPVDNPDGLAACRPTSVDATGGRVTVPLQITGVTGDDGSRTADAVVDTATGDVLPLPVSDSVVGAVFGPGGNLLVRTKLGGAVRLSLFAPDGTLLVQAGEPAGLRDLNLLAYTR